MATTLSLAHTQSRGQATSFLWIFLLFPLSAPRVPCWSRVCLPAPCSSGLPWCRFTTDPLVQNTEVGQNNLLKSESDQVKVVSSKQRMVSPEGIRGFRSKSLVQPCVYLKYQFSGESDFSDFLFYFGVIVTSSSWVSAFRIWVIGTDLVTAESRCWVRHQPWRPGWPWWRKTPFRYNTHLLHHAHVWFIPSFPHIGLCLHPQVWQEGSCL